MMTVTVAWWVGALLGFAWWVCSIQRPHLGPWTLAEVMVSFFSFYALALTLVSTLSIRGAMHGVCVAITGRTFDRAPLSQRGRGRSATVTEYDAQQRRANDPRASWRAGCLRNCPATSDAQALDHLVATTMRAVPALIPPAL